MARRQYGNLDWDRVIFALLKYKTYTAAAAALGVSRVTLWRYTQIPEFHCRWLQAQGSVYSEARAKLEAHGNDAADVVIEIMHDPKAKPADRLRASGFILGLRPTGVPLDDVEVGDFDQDALGLDPEIPMDPDLSWVGQPPAANWSERLDGLDKALLHEHRGIFPADLENAEARQQAGRANATKTTLATGREVHSPSTSSAVPNLSTDPPVRVCIPQTDPSAKLAPHATGTAELKASQNVTPRATSIPAQPNPSSNIGTPASGTAGPNPPTQREAPAAGTSPQTHSPTWATQPDSLPQPRPSATPALPATAGGGPNSSPDTTVLPAATAPIKSSKDIATPAPAAAPRDPSPNAAKPEAGTHGPAPSSSPGTPGGSTAPPNQSPRVTPSPPANVSTNATMPVAAQERNSLPNRTAWAESEARRRALEGIQAVLEADRRPQ